jgi:hypothetical protein
MFVPGQVVKLSIEPAGVEMDGHFRVWSAITKRIKGVRSHVIIGEVIESGERATIRIAEDD